MAVFRIERTRDYTVMSNHHLRDKALSLKSKGLLSMMLSLPEDWNYTTRGLAKICKEGVDAIGGALRELEAAGYIVRHQMRDRQGRISDTEYVIYEQPQPKAPDTPLPDTASPDTENPYLDGPDTEKPAELNIEKSKTQKQTTDVPSTVENKQKFISQIMTSKSPVRSCDDVDETALSFAEIKALCAGDPRIKERMDLDVDVARLKLMKADHQSKQYRLEDQLLKTFPEEIEKNKGFIAGLEADMATLAAHPHPEDGFAGMEVRGDTLTDKENAGAALLDACKEVKGTDPVPVGSYRGFAMSVSFDAFRQEYMLLLKGQMTHRATLGTDPRGNLTRIDNALGQMPQRLEAVKNQLDNLYQQQAAAKAEVGKPFPQEQELRDKSARLAELDVLLNMDGRGRPAPEAVLAKSSRPSVLEGLKRPVPPRSPEKKPKHHEQEAR
ncbi:hypothetical protein HNP82_002931 [Catenibacillus scindens]|uniref:Helix-turn-helix domain-containing protein n=2 Tax=Clostridia TaxID=186801 RepID=A0A7W8M668_9FIRM|nr:hypothetical protein [Catenibacillus scindens]